MNPLESLLPFLSSRVASSGQSLAGGHYARLDNDLYLHTWILGKSGPFHRSFKAEFLLFFNPDGSHATPPFEILGELLTPHLGYDFSSPGGVLGQPDIRDAMRRIQAEFGLGRPSLLRWSVKASHPLPPSAPRHWSQASYLIVPSRKKGPEGFDWAELGGHLLNAPDATLGLLEMTRPDVESQPLQPR